MLRALIAGLFLALAAPVAAQEVLAPNPDIEATIAGQFDAFLAEDVETAWQYASPNIQGLFRTPENFGRMVQQGYPMVWAPAEVDFIDLQTFNGLIVQRVQVIDGAGNAHYLGYQMIETEGGWRINGVQILPAPDVSA
ncbi:DUF4864 domain-containing protein [Roseicyclus persicicus]|uniref:DUF4864 domain-containing protein n=1 Tax=Roseicyclus persicicus TaxID=2650661 RepID=A0A7X6GXL4_9RHOB|nr:DUF4864 domain-containing protein [Roseibacterium persicicum]NKX43166.1 DUF4864 domain-containing protein [Roseibacterium persicicum]